MDELVILLLRDRTWRAGDSMPLNNRLQFPCLMLHIFASFFDFQYYYYILLFCCTSWIYKNKKDLCFFSILGNILRGHDLCQRTVQIYFTSTLCIWF